METRERSSLQEFTGAMQGRSESYRHIRVKPLTTLIGAEIENVDLSADPGEEVWTEISRAFHDHLVIFFRDQRISPRQHIEFGKRFGPLHIHPAAPGVEGHPELMVIAANEHSSRANGEAWHSDVSCDERPPLGSILFIKECPQTGGDTLFSNMYAAYETLSDRMKTYLDGLKAIHDGEHVYRGLYRDLGVQDKSVYPRAEHPIVRTHPVTGKKSLFVNYGFTTGIVGLERKEGQAILDFLIHHSERPEFQCRFRWTENSIAFWDNRCTQHHAIWDYWPRRRYGIRVTIEGERPV